MQKSTLINKYNTTTTKKKEKEEENKNLDYLVHRTKRILNALRYTTIYNT